MRSTKTINEITTEVQALFKNVTGRAPLSAVETDIVYSSIVDAFQIVLLEYGIETFKFNESSITVDTAAAQGYVDLPAYAYKVVNGTVRIPASNTLLGMIDESLIFKTDPDASETGEPQSWAYAAASDVDLVRLALWPIPDAVYTLAMNVLSYPADALASFPEALQSAIKFKAKSLSCLGLGIGAHKVGFDGEYEALMAKIKDGYLNDGPRHVGRTLTMSLGPNLESRIP